ncbi:MAG: hypothetical protein S4CHLAM6_11690 [Chlamydiae bacterium]|nr:hypothetical protein [Chlamydiota bacterium]
MQNLVNVTSNQLDPSESLAQNISEQLDCYKLTFLPSAKIISKNKGLFSTETIKKETDFYAADFDFALTNADPITRYFLLKFLEEPYLKKIYDNKIPRLHLIVDSRIHSLEKGEYPGIPGWHTDFIERMSLTNLELNYSRFNPEVKVYIVNFSDHPKGVSNTEFLTSEVNLVLPKKNVYISIDQQIQSKLTIHTSQVSDGEILMMDQHSLHRISPAHNQGTRGFIRVAVLHDLPSTIQHDKPQNVQKGQVQSYIKASSIQALKNKSENQPLNNTYYFTPNVESINEINEIQKVLSTSEINNEPMLVNCSLEHGLKVGGPITQKFITAVQQLLTEKEMVKAKVNIRIHRLMKDHYPSMYHYPDVPLWRSGIPFDKKIHPKEDGKHFLLFLSDHENGVSAIKFYKNPCHLKIKTASSTHQIKKPAFATQTEKINDKTLICFKNSTLHRALAAHNSGWRLCLMVNIDSTLAENKVDTHSKIYIDGI